MKELDFLFIHPATHCSSGDPSRRDLVTFLVMPLGTMALADLLERNGYSTIIIHTGIEQVHDRGFRVEDIFKHYQPRVVGVDLHWFIHSYDAIRIAEIARHESDAKVVLGGSPPHTSLRRSYKGLDASTSSSGEMRRCL